MDTSGQTPTRRETMGLGMLFGALYFLQGFGEPTEGLISQPVRSLLKSWGHGASEIATFTAILALPWVFKPLYGIVSDFVPLAGSRRKSYLIIGSVAAALVLIGLFTFPSRTGGYAGLLAWLLIPTVAVAFSDVVVDALVIEQGRPLGLTGRLQAILWACMYAATIITGVLGGYLSASHQESLAFLLCGAGASLTLVIAVVFVREPVRDVPRRGLRDAGAALGRAARSPVVLGVGGFLFLWNFNPFSTTVLYVHVTRVLGFGEQFYGQLMTLMALASIAACLAYGTYCRVVPMPVLAHLSIVLGVVSTLLYAVVTDEASAVVVTLAVGFTYMTATLIQLDLAAQACPTETAGTAFATIMALENVSLSLSTWLGGMWYEAGQAIWGSRASFQVLVYVGAGFTAACWLLVPLLPRGTLDPLGPRAGPAGASARAPAEAIGGP